MRLNVKRFSRKIDVKLFAFKYMIPMRLSGSLQLHRTSHMLERLSPRSSLSEPATTGASSDWVEMCFVGIFGYILKSFGLMSPWDHQLSSRAQEWMVVGPLQSRLWVQLVWLPVKMEFALHGIPIVRPLQPVWGIRKGLLFCIFFSGDFSYMWHVHKVPGPVTSTQEPWGCTVSRVFSQRILHYHVQDADVWSVPWAFVESSPGLFLLGEP